MVARGPRRDSWQQFPVSKPLAVDDGVATRKRRGAMADTWWSQRLIAVLDSYGLGGRMERGRRYARQGQIVSLEVRPGVIDAAVQGSRRTPYTTTVRFTPLTEAQWGEVRQAIEATLQFPARLLAGEVPPELEAVFDRAGVALLPRRWNDLASSCSCPDWEVPCKHIAAVLYVLADRLDDDPWLLLAWRGHSRDQLLAHLQPESSASSAIAPWWPLVPGASLPTGVARGDTWVEVHDSGALTRLGPLDAQVRGRPVTDALAEMYRALVDEPEA
jgi:hypothetical protein